ncbi:unnamed protein product [Orchesella dallaii]|uniref:Uncharacterized protein n=1 Tax=Orchesella dallaii TaxID=48710 RepID=A0ABP1QSQ3_9HEXA
MSEEVPRTRREVCKKKNRDDDKGHGDIEFAIRVSDLHYTGYRIQRTQSWILKTQIRYGGKKKSKEWMRICNATYNLD